jgi:colanic acid/amylovoran biosynthesis glycosyltransferase
MRVAFFVPTFPVISETFILRQITGLIDLGHEVDVYAERAPEEGGPVHPEVERYGLLARTVYTDREMPAASGEWQMPVWPITGETWLPGADSAISNLKRVVEAVPAFLRCVRRAPRLAFRVLDGREYDYQARSLATMYRLSLVASLGRRYDVLHVHFGPQGNTFRFARELWDAPLVVSFHGFDFSTLPRQQGRHIYDRLFETADLVTVNSEYTRGELIALGCPTAKLRTLPVGLDPKEFAFRPRTLAPDEVVRVLSIGRLVPIKGHEFAIRAIARIRDRVPDIRYDIIGDGPLRGSLESLIAELRLKSIVTLHGARSGDYVREMLGSAHVFVMPSVAIDGDQEGQGLVLQEAQSCGLPVVATRHGAFPEGMLPGRSGFLVGERDVGDLADRLVDLIQRHDRWPELGSCGRRYVEEKYDICRLNRQLVELYEEARAGYRRNG